MVRIIILYVVLFLNTLYAIAQLNTKDYPDVISNFRQMPQESIFVHYNTSSFFSGERLFYKVYCFNNQSENLSTISKIAYLEMISQDGKVVFKHKIRLENGIGFGDFSIPTSITTGSYKLFGYTHWMKNNNIEQFFQTDLIIINPYQKVSSQYFVKILNKKFRIID